MRKTLVVIFSLVFTFLLSHAGFSIIPNATPDDRLSGRFTVYNTYSGTVNIEGNICLLQVQYAEGSSTEIDVMFRYNINPCANRVARIGTTNADSTVIIDKGRDGKSIYFVLNGKVTINPFGDMDGYMYNSPSTNVNPENSETTPTPSNNDATNDDSPIAYDDIVMSDIPEESDPETQNGSSPKKVFKVIGATFDQKSWTFDVTTENDSQHRELSFYVVCSADFLYTPSGALAGCKSPLLMFAEAKDEKGVLRKGLNTYISHACKKPWMDMRDFHKDECLQNMRSGYVIEVNEGDYFYGYNTKSKLWDYLITADRNVDIHRRFKVCDTRFEIRINENGNAVSCSRYLDGPNYRITDRRKQTGTFTFEMGMGFGVYNDFNIIIFQ